MAGVRLAGSGEPEVTLGCGSGGAAADEDDEDDDEEVPWALLAD
jgi:hypothetical protein